MGVGIMKTPEQATMEFITNHLAKEKDKWEDGRANYYFEWENYSERIIRWRNDTEGYRKMIIELQNRVDKLEKENEELRPKGELNATT